MKIIILNILFYSEKKPTTHRDIFYYRLMLNLLKFIANSFYFFVPKTFPLIPSGAYDLKKL